LKWLELRAVMIDGNPFMLDMLTPAQLKPIAQRLKDEGIGVSFFNSALLKYTLPGTTAVLTEDWYERLYARMGLTADGMYATRNDRLKKALEVSNTVGAKMLRTFSFWRVKEPRSVFPRLVDLFGEMGEIARAAGCKLLVETEYATNVATCEEMRDLMAKLPSASIGINWDPQNSLALETDVFPGGYRKLPVARIWNVQLKAEGLFGEKRLDWGAIMRRLNADGYQGLFGLETHHGQGPQNHAMSHRCMDEMIRLVG
jgi:sugar phosphate isomerase/epimerase